MNFCSQCGHRVRFDTPEDDNRPRFMCDQCGTVHYQNPNVITGTLPVAPDGRILLCRRAIEPRHGYWTLPAGFMENGETTVEGALRETMEEARVVGQNPQLLSMVSLPDFDQVHVFYRVDMPDFSFETTPESSEVVLFHHQDIPWEEIAFLTVRETLEHYLEHLNSGPVPVLNSVVYRPRGWVD